MTIPYYSVYKNRLNLFGDDNKERVESAAAIDFQNYISSTPNRAEVVINDLEYLVSILSSGQDWNKTTKKMLIQTNADVEVGDIVKWEYYISLETPMNYWIVLRKEQVPLGGYQKCYMVKCNKLINWIDQYGIRNSSVGYQVGGMDSIIRDMYDSKNNLYHTTLNQYIQLILPYSDVKNDMRFIIGNQAWKVVNYDKNSVSGTVFVTLKEDLINPYNDQLISNGGVIDLADINKEDTYQIVVNHDDFNLLTGSTFTITPILFINNIKQIGIKFVYAINDNWVMETQDDKFEGVSYVFNQSGIQEYTITIALPEQLNLYKTFKINVIETPQSEITYYIEGTNSIKWGRTQGYILHKYIDGVSNAVSATFTITNNGLATLATINGYTCAITGNTTNSVGIITLTATIGAEVITKEIQIVPIWQVI